LNDHLKKPNKMKKSILLSAGLVILSVCVMGQVVTASKKTCSCQCSRADYGASKQCLSYCYTACLGWRTVNNSATVSFAVNDPGKVSVKIFDAKGELVKVLTDKMYEKGAQQVAWDTRDVQAGVYVVKMEMAGISESKELIVGK
jgi:hypothetical protein